MGGYADSLKGQFSSFKEPQHYIPLISLTLIVFFAVIFTFTFNFYFILGMVLSIFILPVYTGIDYVKSLKETNTVLVQTPTLHRYLNGYFFGINGEQQKFLDGVKTYEPKIMNDDVYASILKGPLFKRILSFITSIIRRPSQRAAFEEGLRKCEITSSDEMLSRAELTTPVQARKFFNLKKCMTKPELEELVKKLKEDVSMEEQNKTLNEALKKHKRPIRGYDEGDISGRIVSIESGKRQASPELLKELKQFHTLANKSLWVIMSSAVALVLGQILSTFVAPYHLLALIAAVPLFLYCRKIRTETIAYGMARTEVENQSDFMQIVCNPIVNDDFILAGYYKQYIDDYYDTCFIYEIEFGDGDTVLGPKAVVFCPAPFDESFAPVQGKIILSGLPRMVPLSLCTFREIGAMPDGETKILFTETCAYSGALFARAMRNPITAESLKPVAFATMITENDVREDSTRLELASSQIEALELQATTKNIIQKTRESAARLSGRATTLADMQVDSVLQKLTMEEEEITQKIREEQALKEEQLKKKKTIVIVCTIIAACFGSLAGLLYLFGGN